ncbi:nucleopolyhedrovirus P10 family protein [Streptomyces marincola]|uniref:nucleopolyhedrovirus P10 family protein n=1 Tax=Streptomyces marincola TaxID=2878388 RepID=UPI001CF559B6|nr:nucleopolyhedrovirus P10 family protein [Streptomyces marincola]UCM87183.1 nucleopolyhedrovirus P10 family protein [Streptomyces marincola]
MGSDQLAHAVRRQLSLGRLLPLGGPADGAWLAERAAAPVLRGAAERVPGVVVEDLRVAPAGDAVAALAAGAPPSALPPGPLRVEAVVVADAALPLPRTTAAVRAALAGAAAERLGLAVTDVDLTVRDVLTARELAALRTRGRPPAASVPSAAVTEHAEGTEDAETAADAENAAAPVAAAVLAVPGVRGLTDVPGGRLRAVEIPADGRRPVRVQVAVDEAHRALDVARAVARAASAAAGRAGGAAVVVTDTVPAGR